VRVSNSCGYYTNKNGKIDRFFEAFLGLFSTAYELGDFATALDFRNFVREMKTYFQTHR